MSENLQKLGELFRMERERQGLSFEEVAATLRVTPEKLAKIENGDTSDFPSQLYFRLFCKSYAEALGIDYTRTLDAINESLGLPSESVQVTAPKTGPPEGEQHFPELSFTSSTSRKPSAVGWSLGIIILIIIIAVGFLKALEPDNMAEALDIDDDAAPYYSEGDTISIPPVMLTLTALSPTFAVIAEGSDTVLAKKLVAGNVYRYAGRKPVQISVAISQAVRIAVNGWDVDFSDHQTGLISALVIDPANLPSYLRQPLPHSPSPEVTDSNYDASGNTDGTQPTSIRGGR